MEDKLKKALDLLEKYEALEADIIISDECWEPYGMATTPRFTQDQWDKVIKLQGERNEILERFKSSKPKPAKCYNCKFGGLQFKVARTTHLHCHNNEKFPVEKMEAGDISPWDTLMEWYCSCELHEPKE